MRKIIRIFVWVLAGLVVLVAALLMYLRSADLSAYQGSIESFVSESLGHELQIQGRFELQFGPETTLIAERVSLRNPDWGQDSELIVVEHLNIVVDTWSILGRPLVIEKLAAGPVTAYIERNSGGQVNWAPELPDRSGQEKGEFDPNRIAFRSVDIHDITVLYVDPGRPRPINLVLDDLTVSPDANDILDLDVSGTVNELPLWADGKLGPWQNFLDGQDIFADLDVSLGEVHLSLDGTIADLTRLEGVEINGALRGADISLALGRLALPPFATGEFEVLANVQQFENGHQLRLDGNLGDIEVFLSGNLDSLLLPHSVRHDFRISGPDVSPVVELFGIRDVPAVPFQVAGDYTREGSLLTFGDAEMHVGGNSIAFSGNVDLSPAVPNWDLRIDASGPDFSIIGPFIRVDGLPQEPFTANGYVSKADSTWISQDLAFVVGENRLTINGQLETGSSGATEIEARASGPDISIIQDFTELKGIPARPFDISAVIRPDPLGVQINDGLAAFGDNRLEVEGIVALQPGMNGSALVATASGPDLHNIALLTDVPYLPPGPFAVSGTVRFENGELLLEQTSASVAELEAIVAGTIGISAGNAGNFDLDVALSGPDLGVIPEIAAIDQLVGEPFSINGNLAYAGDRLTMTEADVALGGLEASLDGYIVGAARLADLSIAAISADSVVLRKLTKLAYLPEGAVRLDGKLEKTETEIHFTDTTMSVGELRFKADGALNLSPRRNDSDMAFEVSGPNMAEVGRIFGNNMLPEKTFSVTGQFHGTPSGFELRPFTATLGETDLGGEFSADLTGKPRITGTLASQHLDLTNPAPLPEEDLAAEAEAASTSDRVFSSEPLNTSWLQKANIDIDLGIDLLTANTLVVQDVRIGLVLLDGGLSIKPFELHEGAGSLKGEFELIPGDNGYSMRGLLDAQEMHVGLMFADDQPVSSLPALSGSMRLAGQGNSVQSLMASANGGLSFRQSSGKVKEMFGSALFKDVLLQVLRTLNPLRTSRDYQTLECGIYTVTVTDGLLTIDDFIIQTESMTTVASGKVNLRNEKLDIAFRAKPREGIGISLGTVANQLLELRGTLKNPRVRVDAGRTATTTGAAVATGGLSLLARGLWDRLSAEADVCKQEN